MTRASSQTFLHAGGRLNDSSLRQDQVGNLNVIRGVARSEWRTYAEEKRAMLVKFNRDRQKLVDEIRRLRT